MLQFILTFLAGSFTVTAYESYRANRLWTPWQSIRWQHFAWALLFLLVVIVSLLALKQIPALDWGWIQWLTGKAGSVYAQTPTKPDPSFYERLLPWWILLVLVLAMPSAVLAEERYFRANALDWSWQRRIAMQIAFGLAHMILGIPLYAALAIGVFGMLLTWRHVRLRLNGQSPEQALADGVAIHLSYNLVIVGMIVLVMAIAML